MFKTCGGPSAYIAACAARHRDMPIKATLCVALFLSSRADMYVYQDSQCAMCFIFLNDKRVCVCVCRMNV